MAARVRKVRHGRFYVYRISDEQGQCLYIGKGSGYRAKNQQRTFGKPVEILERFTSEVAAYRREIELIASEKPLLNKHKGGNGPRSLVRVERTPTWLVEMKAFGTRKWAALVLLRKGDNALYQFLDGQQIGALKNAYATL